LLATIRSLTGLAMPAAWLGEDGERAMEHDGAMFLGV
jgi:hypothetical protein